MIITRRAIQSEASLVVTTDAPVMLSAAKHLFSVTRDPSLALRVTGGRYRVTHPVMLSAARHLSFPPTFPLRYCITKLG